MIRSSQKIYELIGYPISMDQSIRNRFYIGDNISSFTFYIRGPKGLMSVELAGSSIDQKTLAKLSDIQATATPPNSTEIAVKDTPQKKVVDPRSFVVCDEKTLDLVEKKRKENADLSKEQIPDDTIFWKLDYLYTDLSDGFRIILHPIDETTKNETSGPKRLTLQDLFNEQKERMRAYGVVGDKPKPQSEEEFEELRKYRQNQMYDKMANSRFYMLLVGAAVGMSAFIIYSKRRRTNLIGTVFYETVLHKVRQDEFVVKNFGRNVRFAKVMRGGPVSYTHLTLPTIYSV
eukprot:TRINITY_DN24903_c0_g1_i1.p1 TRINITY_DN24903_c0_g1~~TRINITY_DN24903_c0_g1_i1.p1  ORF type:complete len:289 (-),score=73.65 TRINITY_DN24903_c0_g1_i1:34-900(-)